MFTISRTGEIMLDEKKLVVRDNDVLQNVYITNATFLRLYKKPAKYFNIKEYGDLYTCNLNGLLTKKEVEMLSFQRAFLSEDFEHLEVFQQILQYPDNQYDVFQRTQNRPAFHKDSECIRLHQDMESLQYHRLEKISYEKKCKIKSFVDPQRKQLIEEPQKFCLLIKQKFDLKYPPKFTIFVNSGRTEHVQYDLKTLEKNIDTLVESMRFLLKRFPFLQEMIGKDIHIFSPLEKDVLSIKFEQAYRKKLVRLLQRYWRTRLNDKLAFSVSLLEALGLRPCMSCHVKK